MTRIEDGAKVDARDLASDEADLIAELDWCISEGHSGPRTRAALVRARARLAAPRGTLDIEQLAVQSECTHVDLPGDRAKAIERLTCFADTILWSVGAAWATAPDVEGKALDMTNEWLAGQWQRTVMVLGGQAPLMAGIRTFANRVLQHFGSAEGMFRAFSENFESEKQRREMHDKLYPRSVGQAGAPAAEDRRLATGGTGEIAQRAPANAAAAASVSDGRDSTHVEQLLQLAAGAGGDTYGDWDAREGAVWFPDGDGAFSTRIPVGVAFDNAGAWPEIIGREAAASYIAAVSPKRLVPLLRRLNDAEVDNRNLKAAQHFAGIVLYEHRNPDPGDLDAALLENLATRSGLLEYRDVTEPCGPGCVCAEAGELPGECHFVTVAGLAAIDAARAAETAERAAGADKALIIGNRL